VAIPCASVPAQLRLRQQGVRLDLIHAGTTPVASITRSRWSGMKFDTPIERARPSARSSQSVSQVST
jgi:hypothetical protein